MVAKLIKSKLRNQPQILNLMDFYIPVRGSQKRKTSQGGDELAEQQQTDKEIADIQRNYDFDNPNSIDWELLIVIPIYLHCSRKESIS